MYQFTALIVILVKLEGFTEGSLLLGGDVNLALDPLVDVSQKSSYLAFSYLR